jgi:competence ComEA-like helix-hairpin-helix protein
MRIILLALLELSLLACKAGADRSNRQATQPLANNAEQQLQRKRPCINLNTATAEQLQSLPGIGRVIANRIIDYRQRHGPFRRPEQIIIIEGIGQRKYQAISELICVE